ncbi:MAG: hypothetical protein ACLQDV_28990 [Candidatus Binataceae bacterium]
MGIVSLQNRDAAHIFRGHELTAKHRRLSSGLAALDAILDGGIVRGRVSEIVGPIGSGRTSIAARFISAATLVGEVTAWIEGARNFDPADIAAGSASLDRILWASVDDRRTLALDSSGRFHRYRFSSVFKAAEMVLKAGGFGLVVIDIGPHAVPLPQSIALRLAREAERSGTAVIVVAPYRICGTFAALSLKLTRLEASFNRIAPASPALFDGVVIQASTVRNKLGRTGGSAVICGAIDPLAPSFAREDNHPASRPVPIRNASNA